MDRNRVGFSRNDVRPLMGIYLYIYLEFFYEVARFLYWMQVPACNGCLNIKEGEVENNNVFRCMGYKGVPE